MVRSQACTIDATADALAAVELRWSRRRGGDNPAVLCFHHAGGSVLSAGRLSGALPARWDVAAIALPGHEGPESGAPIRRLQDMAGLIADDLAALFGASQAPLILLGNSFGALLAFDVARQMELRHAASFPPVRLHLVASGFRSPSLPPGDSPLHRLPVAHLLAELADRFGMQGIEAGDVLADWQVAALRADLEACETYRLPKLQPLGCPVSVIRLLRDRTVTRDELAAWQDVSARPVNFLSLDAGHFPWSTAPAELGALLADLPGMMVSGSDRVSPHRRLSF